MRQGQARGSFLSVRRAFVTQAKALPKLWKLRAGPSLSLLPAATALVTTPQKGIEPGAVLQPL